MQLLSLTQENAIDLYNMGIVSLTLTTVGEEYVDPVKNMSSYHCMT